MTRKRTTWLVYNYNSGNIVRRCRSQESAEAFIEKEHKSLRSKRGYENNYLQWAICQPGYSVAFVDRGCMGRYGCVED